MWSNGEPNDFNGEEECAQFYVYGKETGFIREIDQ